jgi:hypothetical protein
MVHPGTHVKPFGATITPLPLLHPVSPIAGRTNDRAERRGRRARSAATGSGVQPAQKVYPAHVELSVLANSGVGRPAKYPRPSTPSVSVGQMTEILGFKTMRRSFRRCGTKRMLSTRFSALRVRAAEGILVSHGQHLPGKHAWLVCEARWYARSRPARHASRHISNSRTNLTLTTGLRASSRSFTAETIMTLYGVLKAFARTESQPRQAKDS